MRILVAPGLDDADVERIQREAAGDEIVLPDKADDIAVQVPGCEVLFGWRPREGVIAEADRLRWVQSRSAGVDGFPLDEMAARGIVLSTGAGAHGVPVAENILAMMFAFAIRLPQLIDRQRASKWDREPVQDSKFELDGQTLLIAGLGGIGATLARKASALGMRVLGIRRSAPPPPNAGGSASRHLVAGVDELITRDMLLDALPRANHVALCLPFTPDTTGFLGERGLRRMKRSAHVYNVGSGGSIDRDALLLALRDGWIAGAGLDVTDPEPLPADDPLWQFPNVILSQHTSGASPANSRRTTAIFLDNLRRVRDGRPLRNQVDYERGY